MSTTINNKISGDRAHSVLRSYSMDATNANGESPVVARQTSKNANNTFIQFKFDDDEEKDEKGKRSNGYSRTILLSVLYAILLTFIGLCFPVTEALTQNWLNEHWAAAFLVYLFFGSTCFLLYMQIYHVQMAKKREAKEQTLDNTGHGVTNGPMSVTRKLSYAPQVLGNTNEGFTATEEIEPGSSHTVQGTNFPLPISSHQMQHRKRLENGNSRSSVDSGHGPPPYRGSTDFSDASSDVHEYIVLKSGTATLSAEGGSNLFLRLGCLVFAIANVIYTCLRIRNFYGDCPFAKIVYPFFFHLLFVLVQTFFLFKNCTVVVKRHKGFVRFGVMHVLATNMCNWLRVLVFEIMEGILHADEGIKIPEVAVTTSLPDVSEPAPFALDIAPYAAAGGSNGSCLDDPLWLSASPYLFPFVLEYSLIAVASMAAIYSGLNIHVTKDVLEDVKAALRRIKSGKQEPEHEEHEGEEETFQKAHLGMFIGILLLTGLVVSIILFFHFNTKSDLDTRLTSDLVYQITDIGLAVFMLIATIIGIVKTYPLGFDLGKNNTIDHILLLVSLVGLLLLELFTLIAAFGKLTNEGQYYWRNITILNATAGILKIIQGLLQSIFIIDGLQRYAETAEQRHRKPGRGVITFLIVANVGVWIFKTLQEKRLVVFDEQDFYGIPAWPIIQNISLPLLVFFRFHSSICMAEMWHSCYEKDQHKNIIEEEILD